MFWVMVILYILKVQEDFSTIPRLGGEDFTDARYPFAYFDAQTWDEWLVPIR